MFQDHEFNCKCGCGLGKQDFRPETLDRIYLARRIAGIPFILNSAIRCSEHNNKVSFIGDNSSHLTGAFDIRCDDSRSRFIMIDALIKAGFTRIGISKTFIHADDDPKKEPRLIWTYP